MNWHARDGLGDGNSYNIVYHIPIPSSVNSVGVNYRTAVIQSKIGGSTIMATGNVSGLITQSEYNQIISGSILEYSETFYTNPGQNLSTLNNLVNSRYTELSSVSGSFLTNLANKLKYWGGQSST